jgi:hypothetical protein
VPIPTRGVSHCGLVIYIKKYLEAKKNNIMGTQIYFTRPKHNLPKISSKRNQNLSRHYYNSTTNLKF